MLRDLYQRHDPTLEPNDAYLLSSFVFSIMHAACLNIAQIHTPHYWAMPYGYAPIINIEGGLLRPPPPPPPPLIPRPPPSPQVLALGSAAAAAAAAAEARRAAGQLLATVRSPRAKGALDDEQPPHHRLPEFPKLGPSKFGGGKKIPFPAVEDEPAAALKVSPPRQPAIDIHPSPSSAAIEIQPSFKMQGALMDKFSSFARTPLRRPLDLPPTDVLRPGSPENDVISRSFLTSDRFQTVRRRSATERIMSSGAAVLNRVGSDLNLNEQQQELAGRLRKVGSAVSLGSMQSASSSVGQEEEHAEEEGILTTGVRIELLKDASPMQRPLRMRADTAPAFPVKDAAEDVSKRLSVPMPKDIASSVEEEPGSPLQQPRQSFIMPTIDTAAQQQGIESSEEDDEPPATLALPPLLQNIGTVKSSPVTVRHAGLQDLQKKTSMLSMSLQSSSGEVERRFTIESVTTAPPPVVHPVHPLPIVSRKRHSFYEGLSDCIRLIWCAQYSAAEELLEPYISLIPRCAVLYTEISFLKYMISQYQSDLTQTLQRAEAAEAVCQKCMESADFFEASFQTFVGTYCKSSRVAQPALRKNFKWDCAISKADTLLFRAVIQAMNRNEIKGAFNLRKAYKLYTDLAEKFGHSEESVLEAKSRSSWYFWNSEDVTDIDRELVELVNFGMGLFFYVLSIVPASFLTILRTIGFESNREKGIQVLQQVQSNGSMKAPFAAIILAFDQILMPTALGGDPLNEHVIAMVNSYLELYPASPLFQFLAAEYARKDASVERALRHMLRTIACTEQLHLSSSIYKCELGTLHMLNLEFDQAALAFQTAFYSGRSDGQKTLSRVLKIHPSDMEMRPYAGVGLAACMIASGTPDANASGMQVMRNVKAMLQHVEKTGRNSRFVKFAHYQCHRAVSRAWISPLLPIVMLYLRRDLHHMRQDQLANVKTYMSAQINIAGDADAMAAYKLFTAVLRTRTGRDEEALGFLQECLQLEAELTEAWIIPYCSYEIACVYHRLGMVKEAWTYFERAQNGTRNSGGGGKYEKFEFSDHLRRRAAMALQKLKM